MLIWPCSFLAKVLHRLCILVLLSLTFSGVCSANDHILEKSYWTDVTANASFEQAQIATYTPFESVLNKGYSPNVQWIRLKISAFSEGEPDSLVLRIRPIYLDEISLFDPADTRC